MEEFRGRPFEKRVQESKQLAYKYHDRVPIIVRSGNSQTPTIENFKYLIPKTTTVGQFANTIRKKTQLKSYQALFVFVNGVLPPTSSLMVDVYKEHHDDDGFLYVTYSLENTFGNYFFLKHCDFPSLATG
jgi:GABA(A) receptor-associated protein